MQVKDAMTRHPLTIDPDAPLGAAVEVMRDKHVRHLPVVDDGDRLVGIITDRDLRHAMLCAAVEGHLDDADAERAREITGHVQSLRVRHAMTWGVVTTRPDASLAHAALIMTERRVGSLPVLEAGRLVGVLTEADVLRAVASGSRLAEFDPTGFLW
jgi:CBS domain-containing protein